MHAALLIDKTQGPSLSAHSILFFGDDIPAWANADLFLPDRVPTIVVSCVRKVVKRRLTVGGCLQEDRLRGNNGVFRPLYRTKTVRITIVRVCWNRQLVTPNHIHKAGDDKQRLIVAGLG